MSTNATAMSNELIPAAIDSLIFDFRGRKVMVDADLASLYEVPTKRLKEQVKRNMGRFPEDFMFQLTKEEKDQLVANCDRLSNLKHSSVNPMVFTEQGVAMLSSVLRSEKAVDINIQVMRAFVRYRAILLEQTEMHQRMDHLDEKLDKAFQYLLDRIDSLQDGEQNQYRRKIGYTQRGKHSEN